MSCVSCQLHLKSGTEAVFVYAAARMTAAHTVQRVREAQEKSPPLWGRDNEGGKASDWSRIQNPAF